MTEEAKAARRAYWKKYYEDHPEQHKKAKAYKREWNKKNKEKIKAYNEQYWERKAQEMKDL